MENGADVQNDLLADETNSLFEFTYASQGQRFLNFLIDNIVMRYTVTYVVGFSVGYIMAYLFPDLMRKYIYERDSSVVFLISYIVGIFDYIVYYTILEKLLNGKTIGKFITGTKAIRTDGLELTFKDALLRSLCRLVPLEVFSGFGTPWHDTWTGTMVVKSKNS